MRQRMRARSRSAAVLAAIAGLGAVIAGSGAQAWQKASVQPTGSGNFRVAFTGSAGCAVTLRVRAADGAAGSIAETITRAYQIAP